MRIYADHNATSPLLPEITEQFEALVRAPFCSADLQQARERIAAWLDAPANGVIFTASATEANAFALRGHLSASGKSVSLISAVEHPSVTENAAGEVRIIPASLDGVVTLRELPDDVGVVSVMWANNETGAVQPVREIAALCRARGVRLHIDAVQAAGKLPISLREVGADSYTVSAHKLGAPPGAAALIVCGREPANARIGEEPHHPAILFSYAAEAWRAHGEVWRRNMRAARDAFENELQQAPSPQPSPAERERKSIARNSPGLTKPSPAASERESIARNSSGLTKPSPAASEREIVTHNLPDPMTPSPAASEREIIARNSSGLTKPSPSTSEREIVTHNSPDLMTPSPAASEREIVTHNSPGPMTPSPAERERELAARSALRGEGEGIVSQNVERIPNTSCVLLLGVRGQAVLSALDIAGISVSHGSACATGSLDPSPILLAMGLSHADARSAVRVSFGPHASADEGRAVARELLAAVTRLRRV